MISADTDDIEAYLTTFERLMTAYGVNKSRWIFKLAPQLTGKAQQAYAAVRVTDASDYDAAILRLYDITEEMYRQRFRVAVKGGQETHRELAIRLSGLANKWLKGQNTVDLIKEAFLQEQLLNSLTPSIGVWVKERKPKTSLKAG